jgi:hypothetical protein
LLSDFPPFGRAFLTSFYGKGATKFDELSDIPTISHNCPAHCEVELFEEN